MTYKITCTPYKLDDLVCLFSVLVLPRHPTQGLAPDLRSPILRTRIPRPKGRKGGDEAENTSLTSTVYFAPDGLLPVMLTALVQRIMSGISPLASGDGLLCSNVAAKTCPWASLGS